MTHDTRQGRGRYRTGDDGLNWTGERQVGRTLDAIRPDHVARYKWAAQRLPLSPFVLDVGCGVGYGSRILAPHAMRVEAIDIDSATIEYARKHWPDPAIEYSVRDVMDPKWWPAHCYHAIVALEVLEHVDELDKLLAHFAIAAAPGCVLLASTPNEARRPYSRAKFPFHFRHYTREQLGEHLQRAGFERQTWFMQDDDEPRTYNPTDPGGKFLLVMAVRSQGGGSQ